MLTVRTLRGFRETFGSLSVLEHVQDQKWKKCFTTTSEKCSEKVYELRTYSLHPKDVKMFMELSSQWMHLRTQHSKLIGYWTSEIGGINDMVHIWEYDSLSHRAQVRQALAADPDWVGNYFSKILPWIQRQDNSLLKCLPGTTVSDPPSNGVYESQSFHSVKDLQETRNTIQNMKRPSATLLGSWYSIVGINSVGLMIWHHPDVDNLVQSPMEVDKNSGLTLVQSRLLLPTAWSTMK